MELNFSNQPIKQSETSIFLAGPTYRGEDFSKSWRKDACKILKELGFKGLVYIPEFETGNMKPDLTEQAEWERQGLEKATVILFYINRKLPELPGFTTNIEYGMWLAKRPNACELCIPANAEKTSYIKWLWNREGNTVIHHNLESALKYIVNKLQ